MPISPLTAPRHAAATRVTEQPPHVARAGAGSYLAGLDPYSNQLILVNSHGEVRKQDPETRTNSAVLATIKLKPGQFVAGLDNTGRVVLATHKELSVEHEPAPRGTFKLKPNEYLAGYSDNLAVVVSVKDGKAEVFTASPQQPEVRARLGAYTLDAGDVIVGVHQGAGVVIEKANGEVWKQSNPADAATRFKIGTK